MNTAIVLVRNDFERELSRVNILGSALIDYTVHNLKKLDLDKIFVVGCNFNIEGTSKRDDINELVNDLMNKEGRCLITSPFYPLMEKRDYLNLLYHKDNNGAVSLDEKNQSAIFMLPNSKLERFNSLNLKTLSIERNTAKKVSSAKDLEDIADEIKMTINLKHIANGVNIMDPYSTYIGISAAIDKDSVIYPNTYIEGKCLIGKNNVIKAGTSLVNVIMGDSCIIKSSHIENSILYSGLEIENNCNIKESEILDNSKIASSVEIRNSLIGDNSYIEHGALVLDCQIGSDVTFGAGSVTVNRTGKKKYASIIKDHACIGANSTLIAPVTIGEYSLVASGSTVEESVEDGDMAISRLYQTNRKGFGYKYINKEN